MITEDLQPYVSTAGETPSYFLGIPTTFRAMSHQTNGAFGLVEQVMPPGFASPYHTHQLEDEAFHVIEGTMAFVCGGEWTLAGPGTFVFGPRNIPHGFKVVGDSPARMLLLCAPAAFAQFIVELSDPEPAPPDMARLMEAAARYRIDILGPLPDEPAHARPADGGQAATSNREAVDAVRAQHIAAVNAGDLAAAVGIFAPDATLMPPGQPLLRGEAIRDWFAGMFAQVRLEGFSLRPESVDQHGDATLEHGVWRATLHPTNGAPGQVVGGSYLTAYQRLADGRTRVTRDIFTGLPG